MFAPRCSQALRGLPWYEGFDRELPIDADVDELNRLATCVSQAFASSGARLAAMRSQTTHVPLDEAGDTAAPGPTPEEMAERSEVAELIRQLMAKLSDQQRLTFTMFYVDGYSEEDVSDMLEIPVGTVKSRTSRARQVLRGQLLEHAKDLHLAKDEP